MKVAIIAWGSLVHAPAGAAPSDVALELDGEWKIDGPILSVEFSRVSKDGRLTLVIDETNGTKCVTYHACARATELASAVENLRRRERMPTADRVGQMSKGEQASAGPREAIRSWLSGTSYDAVIWTDLSPNFFERTGRPFSVDAALEYLESLQEPVRTSAYRYIVEAPNTTATGLRKNSNWPEVTSVHEGGHTLVACALGLRLERLSRIPVVDPPGAPATRGLRATGDRSDAGELALKLAGPWSQVVYFPTSIPDRNRDLFTTRIVVPTSMHPRAAWDIYDQTGWDASDLKPAWQFLQLASIPYPGAMQSYGQVLVSLDEHLGRWMRGTHQARAIGLIQSRLMAQPVLVGHALAQLEYELLQVLPTAQREAVLPAGLR
jgi:hypothetical protein